MDFRFNVNNLLTKRINKITHTLVPEDFRGDRREFNECQRLLTRILDDVGEASAKAQGLNRTITSALKLRDTDHIIYLMIDSNGNNCLGSVVGLLKTGSKTLFMFDENGYHYQIKPRCILDFYIHESQQRKGLGRELYEYMLEEENLKPIKLAIDRPSEKFLAFLKKHYELTSIIPQNNKFVVFKGFFDNEIKDAHINRYTSPLSQNPTFNEHKIQSNDNVDVQSTSINGTPVKRSAYGRYAASRPPCSMANIIHNTSAMEQPEHSRSAIIKKTEVIERPDSLNLCTDSEISVVANYSINKELNIEIDSLREIHHEATLQTVEPSDQTDEKTAALLDINDKCLNEKIGDNDICPSTTSTCCQEEVCENNQSNMGHLDLKFYHSPLW